LHWNRQQDRPLRDIGPPALSQEQLRQLTEARGGFRRIRRAVAVARIDAWTIAVFAGLTLVCGLFSLAGVAMGAGMGIIAYVEFRGAGGLGRLETRWARVLGWNQLAFAGMLITYAVWSILRELSGVSAYGAIKAADPGLAGMLQPFEGLARLITLAVYGGLIAVAVFAQGGMALFYYTRARHIRDYLAQTAPWILQMQKAGISL
jgi:hypothetical protein